MPVWAAATRANKAPMGRIPAIHQPAEACVPCVLCVCPMYAHVQAAATRAVGRPWASAPAATVEDHQGVWVCARGQHGPARRM